MLVKKILAFALLLLAVNLNANAAPAQDTDTSGEKVACFPVSSKNFLSFAPIQLLESNYGFGISLEHFVGKGGKVSVCLPLFPTWNMADNGRTKRKDQMTFFAPELKIYVTDSRKAIRYALGPVLLAGIGQTGGTSAYYDNATATRLLFGAMVGNSVNICPLPHIYYGVDLDMGFTYVNRIDGKEQGSKMITHGAIKIGYRF